MKMQGITAVIKQLLYNGLDWRNKDTMDAVSILTTTRNTRDLGGHHTADGHKVICNRIYRSDRQEYPSQADIALLGKVW